MNNMMNYEKLVRMICLKNYYAIFMCLVVIVHFILLSIIYSLIIFIFPLVSNISLFYILNLCIQDLIMKYIHKF